MFEAAFFAAEFAFLRDVINDKQGIRNSRFLFRTQIYAKILFEFLQLKGKASLSKASLSKASLSKQPILQLGKMVLM